PPIGDAMHVNVHTDQRPAPSDADDEVGAFRPDAVEGTQHFRIVRQSAAIIGYRTACNFLNLPGLGFVKGAGANKVVDLLGCEAEHFSGRARAGEEPASSG